MTGFAADGVDRNGFVYVAVSRTGTGYQRLLGLGGIFSSGLNQSCLFVSMKCYVHLVVAHLNRNTGDPTTPDHYLGGGVL